MPEFNVHLYREMRLFYPGMEADDADHAARIADAMASSEASLIEDCDGATLAALVDVIGDEEYTHSRMIDFDPMKSAAPDLLEACEVARAELENHTAVPGVKEHILPCIDAAIRKARPDASVLSRLPRTTEPRR